MRVQTLSLHWLLWLACGALPAVAASISATQLGLDPHIYAGPRGGEPSDQMVGRLLARWGNEESAGLRWKTSLHFEGEMTGRRDVSLDVDRAWLETPLASGSTPPVLVWGRAQPWELSGNPSASHPWGLAGSLQPQNRGVLLGYGYNPSLYAPDPILLGWIGAHFWSARDWDRPHSESRFAWGISASPLYLPPSGSEVSLFKDRPSTTGRFARRPPQRARIGDAVLPLRYDIDRSHLAEDVLFQPQAMAQAAYRVTSHVDSWLSVQRAPSPSPSLQPDGYIDTSDPVFAVARVRPRFPQQWTGTLTTRWLELPLATKPYLRGSLAYYESRHWGYELAAGNTYLELSYLDAFGPKALDAYGGAPYVDSLLQVEARYPAGSFQFYSGGKRHLSHPDLWWRMGTRYAIQRGLNLDLGGDLFSGGDATYFGEWRSNDRLYLVLTWEVGA